MCRDPQDDCFFVPCTPVPLSENANYSKASSKRATCAWGRSPLLALDEAGLSEPAGRTVPGDGCKRPNQTVISGQQNAWEAAKREVRASCPYWSASAPLDCHVSSKLASVLTHTSLGTLRLHLRTKQSLLGGSRQPRRTRKSHPDLAATAQHQKPPLTTILTLPGSFPRAGMVLA